MIFRTSFFILALLSSSLAIDQICNTANPCPTQSFCNNNGYCQCNSGFIGTCNTPALPISSSQVTTSLTAGQTTFFSVNPQQLQTYIQFTFNVCQTNPLITLTFTLWGEDGTITQFNSNTALTQPSSLNLGSGCSQLVSPYMSFNSQPNGQNDLLILGIYDNSFSTNIQISVSQKSIIGFKLYQYILFALGAAIVLGMLGAIIFVFFKRRTRNRAQSSSASSRTGRHPREQTYNNIEHFQIFMPTFCAKQLGIQRSICPICLQQIEVSDVVRRTPCSHIFHSLCLDSWCMKTINCPVCRNDLGFESLNQPRKSRMTIILNDKNGFNLNWQQQSIQQPKGQNAQQRESVSAVSNFGQRQADQIIIRGKKEQQQFSYHFEQPYLRKDEGRKQIRESML